MNVTERINRILFILSYVSQHQGVRVEELARQAGMRPRQLLKELDFMVLIGKPPFRPDDYVDIYVEDQRVYIEFDQMLNRPLRFTRPQAMALVMSLRLLDPEVDPEGVKSLRQKIEALIAESIDLNGRLEDRIVLDRPSNPMSEYFARIRKAIEEHRKLEIEYYSLMRNQKGSRVIRPYFLMKNLGFWYLTGYCELRQDLRTFKFERILSVKLLRDSFSIPSDFNFDRFKENFLKSMGSHRIEIHFDGAVAPWVREQWGSSARDCPGGVILTLYSDTLEYPSRLVLGNAPHARALYPPELIDKVKDDAREVLELYESKAVKH